MISTATGALAGPLAVLVTTLCRVVAEAAKTGAASTAPAPAVERAEKLFDLDGAAAFVGVDVRTWRRLVSEGRAPQPLRLGRKVMRWNPAVLDEWSRTGLTPPPPVEPAVVVEPKRGRSKKKNAFEAAREKETT